MTVQFGAGERLSIGGLYAELQFELDLLPDALRSWVADVADRVQCPPDFAAATAILALGSVVGRRVAVFPKTGQLARIREPLGRRRQVARASSRRRQFRK